MPVSPTDYWGSDTFVQIFRRLISLKPAIDITNYIAKVTAIGFSASEGITFEPTDHLKLMMALGDTKEFAHDDRKVLIQRLAASQTKGEGFRQKGSPSLHCEISAKECNIHLDEFGFVLDGPDGKSFYNPDLLQHVFHDLLWQDKIVTPLRPVPLLGDLLARLDPELPNSSNNYQIGKYRLGVGAHLTLKDWSNLDGSGWRLTVDVSKSCGDYRCRKEEDYVGISLRWRR